MTGSVVENIPEIFNCETPGIDSKTRLSPTYFFIDSLRAPANAILTIANAAESTHAILRTAY
jgi:hypothetical protein